MSSDWKLKNNIMHFLFKGLPNYFKDIREFYNRDQLRSMVKLSWMWNSWNCGFTVATRSEALPTLQPLFNFHSQMQGFWELDIQTYFCIGLKEYTVCNISSFFKPENNERGMVLYKILLKLLAPQSGAHGRGAFRDFQPNPVPLLSLNTYMYIYRSI